MYFSEDLAQKGIWTGVGETSWLRDDSGLLASWGKHQDIDLPPSVVAVTTEGGIF